MRTMRAALALAAGVLLAAGATRAQNAPLYVIATETVGKTVPNGAAARVRLTSEDAPRLAKLLGAAEPIRESSFEYTIAAYPQLPSPPDRTWLEPTFMIDFDEPVFAKLDAELAKLGKQPSGAQIEEFVNQLVDENVKKNWDLASQVAANRTGDCTEHAVLSAALLRRAGRPARMAMGVAIMVESGTHASFGHAWAEALEDGKWVVVDAALHGAPDTVRYVPLGVFADEGMGYAIEFVNLTRAWVNKVVVLGPAN